MELNNQFSQKTQTFSELMRYCYEKILKSEDINNLSFSGFINIAEQILPGKLSSKKIFTIVSALFLFISTGCNTSTNIPTKSAPLQRSKYVQARVSDDQINAVKSL